MTQYLIRLDDLCPTMDRQRFERMVALLRQYSIHPIASVVPDNRDPLLQVDAEYPEFWQRMRSLQEEGWTIALHGYRHICESRGTSLVPIHQVTEFAGAPEQEQYQMLEQGANILRAQGLEPEVWVAPRHGFDHATLRGLKRLGILTVSDGLFRRPYTEQGILWIPQQIWKPRRMPPGVWTICYHPNHCDESCFRRLAAFLQKHHAEFTDLAGVTRKWSVRPKKFTDSIESWVWLRALRWKIAVRQSLLPVREV